MKNERVGGTIYFHWEKYFPTFMYKMLFSSLIFSPPFHPSSLHISRSFDPNDLFHLFSSVLVHSFLSLFDHTDKIYWMLFCSPTLRFSSIPFSWDTHTHTHTHKALEKSSKHWNREGREGGKRRRMRREHKCQAIHIVKIMINGEEPFLCFHPPKMKRRTESRDSTREGGDERAKSYEKKLIPELVWK